METEIWKDIVWYEWKYQISSFGRVKSFHLYWWIKDRIMKEWFSSFYFRVILSNLWMKKQFYVHRLVAQAFLWLDINNKKIETCHRDDNPSNNRLDNLFLWTHKDNMNDRDMKWRGKLPMTKPRDLHPMYGKIWDLNPKKISVLQLTLQWDTIKEWQCIKTASRSLWIHSSHISAVCRWRRKITGWFKWRYK